MVDAKVPNTYFAPAERASSNDFDAQVQAIEDNPIMGKVLETLSGVVMVLNPQRQIIAANVDFLRRLGMLGGDDSPFGQRPGEAVGCSHAANAPGGCGTTMHCRNCGAVQAILGCQQAKGKVVKECLLTLEGDKGDLEFEASASPLTIDDQVYTVLCMKDISDQKRKESLERVFFHDILNTMAGLRGWSELMVEEEPDELPQMATRICRLTDRLISEVQFQQALMAAEAGELVLDAYSMGVARVLGDLADVFENHESSMTKELVVPEIGADEMIFTDPSLLGRILVNLVKNAFEAIGEGGVVTVGYAPTASAHRFTVHNAGMMPEVVQSNIFQRSFSTKSEKGRGLGTYSVKMFVENGLGGTVGFSSTEEEGTTFFVELSREIH